MNTHQKTRGVAETAVVIFLAGMAAGVFFGNWNPFYKLLGKEPPTKQLTQLQAERARAVAEHAARIAELEESQAEERAALESQVRSAQEDSVGVAESIRRVPAEHRTAEVELAAAMNQRVSLKLAAAIGQLPPAQQRAMIDLIDKALSEKQAELDEAKRMLAARDAEFATLTAQRDNLVRETIPKLQKRAEEAENKALELDAKVIEKTADVKQWAADKYASDAQARTLEGTIAKLFKLGALLAAGYFFVAFVLPGLIKHMGSGRVKNFLRGVAGYLTSPLLYHDAKKKISAAKEDGA